MPVVDDAGNLVMQDCGTWVAVLWPQDDRAEPLEVHDTGVPVVDGDLHDGPGLDACFKFYRSVRDKYARDDIEELKPAIAKLRQADKIRQEATDTANEKIREIEEMTA